MSNNYQIDWRYDQNKQSIIESADTIYRHEGWLYAEAVSALFREFYRINKKKIHIIDEQYCKIMIVLNSNDDIIWQNETNTNVFFDYLDTYIDFFYLLYGYYCCRKEDKRCKSRIDRIDAYFSEGINENILECLGRSVVNVSKCFMMLKSSENNMLDTVNELLNDTVSRILRDEEVKKSLLSDYIYNKNKNNKYRRCYSVYEFMKYSDDKYRGIISFSGYQDADDTDPILVKYRQETQEGIPFWKRIEIISNELHLILARISGDVEYYIDDSDNGQKLKDVYKDMSVCELKKKYSCAERKIFAKKEFFESFGNLSISKKPCEVCSIAIKKNIKHIKGVIYYDDTTTKFVLF